MKVFIGTAISKEKGKKVHGLCSDWKRRINACKNLKKAGPFSPASNSSIFDDNYYDYKHTTFCGNLYWMKINQNGKPSEVTCKTCIKVMKNNKEK